MYHNNKNFKMNIIIPNEAHFYCCKCKADRNMEITIPTLDNIDLIVRSEINNSEDEFSHKSLMHEILAQLDQTTFKELNPDEIPAFIKSKMDKHLEKLNNDFITKIKNEEYSKLLNGKIFQLTCLQCREITWLVTYKSCDGMKTMLLSEHNHSIATEHTPKAVKYYLDQAWKAKNAGANSSAVAMYRAALDNLLVHKGYKTGDLADKIQNLSTNINNRTAGSWTRYIKNSTLTTLRKLGNGSIHPNDGDISKQSLLSDDLVDGLDIVFQALLHEAYERQEEENARNQQLNKVAKMFDSRQ